nr:unnamed protein product [uncultured bacterium]
MERKLSLLDAYTQIPKRIGVMSMTREEEINDASKTYWNKERVNMKYLGLHKILWTILVLV